MGKDGDDDGEEVVKDIGCVFLQVKQENSHGLGDGPGDSNIWCRHSKRWRIR